MTPSDAPAAAPRSRTRFPTSTLTDDGHIIPWLAARGPLSYRPEEPPDRDYFFQYTWVLPEIFAEDTNRRRHYFFGAYRKDDARDVFPFWNAARKGVVHRVACLYGKDQDERVASPMAVYRTKLAWGGDPAYLLMQHGSYQLVSPGDQPSLESGVVMLYRGVRKSSEFRYLASCGRGADRQIRRTYFAVQAHALSDAVRSFTSIHDRAVRCETDHIRDRSWMSDDLTRMHGLDIDGEGFASELWTCAHQSFTLARDVAKWKFGPHYVVLKTPLDNIRLTTFFAGEREVRIVDPARVEIVEEHGCQVVDTGPYAGGGTQAGPVSSPAKQG
ncbi:MAG: hypothetical protein FJZ01_10215 [Candidatus Sericytochromatia bacterium]|nr:hypothetical protein [Candidatus Tanganyikabacteria bacterium]